MSPIQELITACEWAPSTFLIFSENVFDPFIYYSHITPLLLSLFIGLFVLWQNPKQLTNRILFAATTLFSAWVFFDLILWASEKPEHIMFFWSLLVLIEPFIYAAMLYFVQVFVTGNDTSLKNKLFIVLPLLPTALLWSTSYSLYGFNLSNCDREAVEGPLALYGYAVEVFYVLWIAVFSMERIRKTVDRTVRRQMELAAIGVLLFLLTFAWGNIVGSFSDDWRVPQWGLFGMPIFLAFLSYLVVKYQALSIKVLAAQVLVAALVALIGSELLFVRSYGNRVLVSITLGLAVVFGFFLVKSVKREVRQRELIQKQEQELEVVNKQQENLLHFISHEIKGYLTKSEAGFSAITEGDYGAVPEQLKTMAASALADVGKGVRTVIDLLSASNLKKGTVTFKKAVFDFRVAVQAIIAEQQPAARAKNLEIDVWMTDGKYRMEGDEEKLREHVIRNLIDNAIRYTPSVDVGEASAGMPSGRSRHAKSDAEALSTESAASHEKEKRLSPTFTAGYTPTGAIRVELSDGDGKIHFSVKDSGVGITPEDMKNLFTEGGHGKDSIKINVHSTGYGLFIAKEVVEAEGGKIWAESEGAGKGSRFVVELPAT